MTEAELVDAMASWPCAWAPTSSRGRSSRISSEPGKEQLARAIAEAAYAARRQVRGSDACSTSTSSAPARSTPIPTRSSYVPPWLRRAGAGARRAPLRPGLADRAGGAPRAGRRRPGAARPRHAPAGARGDEGRSTHAPPTGHRALPDAGVGDARAPGSSRRPRSTGCGARSPTSCRLDEPDPVAAWEQRLAELSAAPALDELGPRRAAVRGPGHRSHASGCCRRPLAAPPSSRPSTASCTRPTSPPRRCSPRPTPSAWRAS